MTAMRLPPGHCRQATDTNPEDRPEPEPSTVDGDPGQDGPASRRAAASMDLRSMPLKGRMAAQ